MITKYIKRPFHKPNYKITTDNEQLVSSLCLEFGGYISDAPCSDTYDITIRGPSVKYEDKEIDTDKPLQILDNLFFEKAVYDETVLALHGGAVGYNGKAYLFLASTTTGKTTLVSYLTSAGFTYITDDCILIDRQNFYVHPYICPIHLREGGYKVLKKYNAQPQNAELLDAPSGARYTYTPDNYITGSIPLGCIYFISRSETENNVSDMSATESITELMKSPITPYTMSGEYIRLISKVAKTGCKRLIYSDIKFVSDTIKLLLQPHNNI